MNEERVRRVRDRARSLPHYGLLAVATGARRTSVTDVNRYYQDREEETLRPIQGLDMSRLYHELEESGGGCQTIGCLAGLTITMFPDETREYQEAMVERGRNREVGNVSLIDSAAHVLGLDGTTASALFLGTGWPGDDLSAMTPEMVTGALDRVLAGARGHSIWKNARGGSSGNA